jgi:hypothetical protein
MDEWMDVIRAGSVHSPVSAPFKVEHKIHVDFSSDSGFVGLPSEWY